MLQFIEEKVNGVHFSAGALTSKGEDEKGFFSICVAIGERERERERERQRERKCLCVHTHILKGKQQEEAIHSFIRVATDVCS